MSRGNRPRLGRTAAIAVLALGSLAAPGLAPAARAATTGAAGAAAEGNGTWRYYGTSGAPLTSAWHCGQTEDLPRPWYVSVQACVIKQSGYEQVALVANARAANNVELNYTTLTEKSSLRTVYWGCRNRSMALGFTVCYGGTVEYSGKVTAEVEIDDVRMPGAVSGTMLATLPVSA